LGSFFRITEEGEMFWLLFASVKFLHLFGQNMGWATFWAIFSQTHLVTLLYIDRIADQPFLRR
jgi:hypothetical protein